VELSNCILDRRFATARVISPFSGSSPDRHQRWHLDVERMARRVIATGPDSGVGRVHC
jgi:hypothetical protein